MEKFQVVIPAIFVKEFRKLSKDLQEIAKKELYKLAEGIIRGDPLKYDLAGFYSLHFHRNKYRIIYTKEDNILKILTLHIGKRTDNFYNDFKKEMKRRQLQFGQSDAFSLSDLSK